MTCVRAVCGVHRPLKCLLVKLIHVLHKQLIRTPWYWEYNTFPLLLLCNSYGAGKTVIVPENKVKPEGD